ncbi:MAG: DUF1326 domain-containing protein [Nitrospirota bacterium]
MTYTDWSMKGPEVANCNCAYGCPCQFNALPTHGNCRAYTAMRIDQGHFGAVKLDGLAWVLTLEWPGPVHLGNGACQAIIDERATPQQREALAKILYGKEAAPGSSVLQVYSTTMSKMHEPVYRPIQFSVDIQKRTARVSVPELLTASVEPIKNPVTGAEHRAAIELPQGFEYTKAEVASGTATATGAVRLDLQQTHSHMAMIHLTQNGVVR